MATRPRPVKTSRLARNLKIAAAATALLAAIAAVVAAVRPSSADDKANTTGSYNTGSYNSGGINCTASGSGATAHCVEQLMADDTLTDPQFRREMANLSTAAPAAQGPYEYVVVDTGKLGLKVRTGPEATDEQFGSAANRSIIWAECQMRSAFDADPSMKAGPVWLKIHWPSTTGTQWANSQPKDPVQGWVFAGYVIPAGHNGRVPACGSTS